MDEGLDVPDSELDIFVSGTGSRKQFVQVLRRLLRPRLDSNKNAKLIEIVYAKTTEIHNSAKKLSALYKEDMKEHTGHRSAKVSYVARLRIRPLNVNKY